MVGLKKKKKKLYMRFYGYKQYCFLKSLSIILKVENPKYVKHIPPWSLSAASVDATTQIWLQRNKLDINIFSNFLELFTICFTKVII